MLSQTSVEGLDLKILLALSRVYADVWKLLGSQALLHIKDQGGTNIFIKQIHGIASRKTLLPFPP